MRAIVAVLVLAGCAERYELRCEVFSEEETSNGGNVWYVPGTTEADLGYVTVRVCQIGYGCQDLGTTLTRSDDEGVYIVGMDCYDSPRAEDVTWIVKVYDH